MINTRNFVRINDTFLGEARLPSIVRIYTLGSFTCYFYLDSLNRKQSSWPDNM